MRLFRLLATLTMLLLGWVGSASATPVITAFSDSATLDFSGNFTYALTMNPNANGAQVGDAQFTYAVGGATPGVSESHQNYIQNWVPFSNNSTPDNIALTEVMRSIIWSGGGNAEVVSLTMSNLLVGETYKYQLLFGESCCDRGFDVFMNHILVADNFSPFVLNGNHTLGGAVISDSFVASSSSVTFGLGYHGGRSDWNPILNAATLERVNDVPEPETLALLFFGLGVLGWQRRRRS